MNAKFGQISEIALSNITSLILYVKNSFVFIPKINNYKKKLTKI